MHFRREIPEIQQQLLECNTMETLDSTTNSLLRAIFRCCRKDYKLKAVKKSSEVTWWAQELNIKKKEMRVVQRRASNTTCTEQTIYHLVLSWKKVSTRNFPSEPNEHP
ncbi:hypothetical protein AVEN_115785-1 [Araneus ventricosus]|uniref:Uncharacterized protein n=1 Tax=Araneus ventricosus TaxID=182803 RepID=A0A4Y2MQZ6_ARAVE|nr:hypothetical protein AVEN_115785-1 [Araneus ventricosus]